jgi:hypothetical protein
MTRDFLIGCLLAVVTLAGGCATVTGTVTGALTGAVDAPAETYRHNREAFEKEPMLFGVNALGMGAVGIVTGPVFGLGKGLSLDVQCLIGQMDYRTVFRSYDEPSIWRPHTVHWSPKEDTRVVD